MRNLTRRDFLKGAAIAVGSTAIALTAGELLVPRRTIVLPPRGGWPVQGGGYQVWRWDQNGLGPSFMSIQNAEWTPIYPQTAAEFNAGVYPVRTEFPPGDARRYAPDPRIRDLFAYADGPRAGNLNLEIYI